MPILVRIKVMMKWILETVKDVILFIRRVILHPLLAFLFPSFCLGCGQGIQAGGVGSSYPLWCPSCWEGIVFCEERRCLYCAHDVPYVFTKIRREGLLFRQRQRCGECRGKKYIYDGVWSLFHYHSPFVQRALYHFKYAGHGEMASVLAPMLWYYMRESLPSFDVVVPVPLHFLRLWWRGYNQSYLLAQEISRLSHRGLLCALKRKRFTKPQGRLDRKSRKENLKDAFRLNYDIDIKGKDVLLVDDVFTTGSTVLECARVLKRAGARKIYVTTLAIVL